MKKIIAFACVLVVVVLVAIPAVAAVSPHSQAVIDGTLLHKGAKDYAIKVDSAKMPDGKPIDEFKGKEIAIPSDKAAECEKMVGKKVMMECTMEDCKCLACASIKEQKTDHHGHSKDESPAPKK